MATMTPHKPSPDRTRRRKYGMWIGVGAFLLVLLIAVPVALLVFGDDDGSDDPGPGTSTPPTTTPITEPVDMTIYWLADHIQNSNKPGPHLVPFQRTIDVSENSSAVDRIRAAMIAAIGGPEDAEIDVYASLSSGVPAGTELLEIAVDDGIVTADFNDTFASGGGTLSVMSRLAQIVYTATSFEGIDGVVFAIDGETVDVFSSEGIVLDGPQTRADFEDLLPLVMIESPLPGAEVMSPVNVAGVANAFEASVSFRIETTGGEVLAESFTTATCGTGCFGEFGDLVYFDVEEETAALVVAFEYSANDGSPVNEFAVPVTLMPGGEAPPVDPGPDARQYDIDPSSITAVEVQGTTVVDAAWGSSPGQVGLDEIKDAGPCCFAVSGEQEIVLLDSQNLRLTKYVTGEDPQVLADFDASELVPEAVAIIRDKVIVIGRTNTADRPYDVVALSLESGAVLERVETNIEINVDLRATSDGVYWAQSSSNPQWTIVADSAGILLPLADQRLVGALGGESTLDVYYDAGIEVNVQPAGDSALSTFDVSAEEAFFAEVHGYPRFADGALVLLGSTFDAEGKSIVTLLAMGTNLEDELEVDALEFEVERAADVGSFGTFRYAAGGFYALSTTDDGIEIVRYELT